MNATNYYVSTSRVVIQGDPDSQQTWQDLYRTLPILRNSLSCTVCESLLVEPYTPEDSDCEHHVCKSCRGGQKVMKPACSWCKDYTKYYENVQLRILIQNYKKLCGLIKITRLWSNLVKQGDQGSDIMDIVRESEGEKLKNLRKHKFGLRNDNLVKQEEVEPMDEVRDDPETGDVEPPDEIISSPASKLNIYTNNPDISKVDNIKVKLLEELTQLSPGVSPPHSSATSPSHSSSPMKTRKIKETFVLNPFKGKEAGTVKKFDAAPKVEPTSLLRKHSLDLNSEKQLLIKAEPGLQYQPQSKVTRLSLDNSILTSDGVIKEELELSKIPMIIKTEASESLSVSGSVSSAEQKKSPSSRSKMKKSGCRCGNATLCPGKLTCCGQRCPCYVDNLPCIDCKCRGCRNPHLPGGGKARPALPMMQNMKVLYPGSTSKDGKITSNSVIFQPVKSVPEKVVYKSLSSTDNKIVYPIRAFSAKNKKDSVRMPVNTINIKDLDLSKLPIISLASSSTSGNISTITIPISHISSSSSSKPVTRIVARSSSLQK